MPGVSGPSDYSLEPPRHPSLQINAKEPFNAEPPRSALVSSYVTPVDFFYKRNHGPIPVVDDIHSYSIYISGFIENPKHLFMKDIRALPKYNVTATLQCAGNRRTAMSKTRTVKGVGWDVSAIGNGAQSPSPGPSANEDTEFESRRPGPESFRFVADLLRSKGYSIMAAFLDAQLVSFKRKTSLTIFAPVDEAIEDYQRNTTDYSLIFRQHVVPRMLLWQDLVGLDDGTMLPTFEEGFMINVIKFGEVPALNEVAVVSEDMYQNRWLVVHGLNRLLTSQEPKQQDPVDDIYTDAYVAQSVPHHDYGDFH